MSDAQMEAEELVNAMLPHAEGMLAAHGEFFPFGGVMTVNGNIEALAVSEEYRDSSVEAIVEELKSRLRKGADTNAYRATALVFPIQAQLPGTGNDTDAVAISLDHLKDFSVVLIIPYELSGGAVEFGEAVAQQGEHAIFQRRH